ncbi:unnamed protein product [Oreochromis niloticus]|nr:unnamed protein product [Mustela putorius furo]
MTAQAILRVILGPDSSQRVMVSPGLPSTVTELEAEIKTQCKIMEPFRLQLMDTLFGNEFVNLTSMAEIQNKATIKIVYTSCQPQDQGEDRFSFPSTSAPDDTSTCGDSTDDIVARGESLIEGLCVYLNENPDILVQEYMDMTEATALIAIEKTTVGIYVSRDTPGNYSFDVGIIIEGVVVLKDLDNVAIVVAMLFGLLYSVNMSYPSQLRYTFEVIQKVLMVLDATELSRKAQNFKTKLLM